MNAFLPLRETSVRPPLNFAGPSVVPGRIRRILVLDDDEMTRRVVALMLARVGYAVDTAEDGEQGWEAFGYGRYDLLVTDNDMPRLSGMQLIERLRFAGLTIPVIVVSGSLELGEVEDYPWLALAAILHKPFVFADLVSAARRAVPIAPDAGEGVVHCLEPQLGTSVHFPFPMPPDARPEVFAKTYERLACHA